MSTSQNQADLLIEATNFMTHGHAISPAALHRHVDEYMSRCPNKGIYMNWREKQPDRFMTLAAVSAAVMASEAKVLELVKMGAFPAPCEVAGKRVWDRNRVQQYLDLAVSVAKQKTNNAKRDNEMAQVATPASAAIQNCIPTTIPTAAKAHKPLRAYDSEVDAYVAGNWFIASLTGHPQAIKECRRYGLQVSAIMTADNGNSGGYVVPIEINNAFLALREKKGIFPRFANNFPMKSDISIIPRLLGGATAQWAGETVEITASDETMGAGEMVARKLGSLCKTSSEIDEDAVIDLAETLTTAMAFAQAAKIDDAAFNGDGGATYGGVVGLKNALDSAAIATAAAGNTGALTLDQADFEACASLVGDYDGMDPCWFMTRQVYFAACTRLQGGQMNPIEFNGVMTPSFLAYPVVFVSAMDKTTTASPEATLAYFGDLKLGATYGTRRSARTEISTGRWFEEDVIGIKTTERLAIVIHEVGDSDENRPIAALKTAAA